MPICPRNVIQCSKIDESDPLSIRIKNLKSRILQAQRELEGSEPTVKQIISPPKEEDINKRNEMSDLRAKLMPKPEKKEKFMGSDI